MVNALTVRDGIVSYINSRIIPKLNPTQQFVGGTIVGIIGGKFETIVSSLSQNPTIKMLGIIDDNMGIDVESAYSAAMETLNRMGKVSIEVPVIGTMTFTPQDLQEIYESVVG